MSRSGSVPGAKRGGAGSEELDRGDEHEVREHAARAHRRRDARADDVADAEQLGRISAETEPAANGPRNFLGTSFQPLNATLSAL
jgi:hypothetical protein